MAEKKATDLAKVSVKGDAQTTTLLKARLTDDSAMDVRLAAVTAIGQVAEKKATDLATVSVKGDAQTITLPKAQLTDDRAKDVSPAANLPSDTWPRRRPTDLAKVSVKSDAQPITLLEALLTDDSVMDVRLAAVTARHWHHLGRALGYLSCIVPVICLGVTILVAHTLCGRFSVALGALGMLGTMTMALTIDA